jgi:hypothetical protein
MPCPMARLRRSPALCVALTVLVFAGAGLTLTAHRPPVRLAQHAAVSAVLGNRAAADALRGTAWDRASVSAVDAQLERVSFYARGRIVFEAALDRNGSVTHASTFINRPVPYGNALAFEPPVLIGLSLLFVLMAGVAPARRLRNLDVVALLSFLAPVMLLQKRYVDASVISALPGLAYLTARCALAALRPAVGAPESTPLYLKLTVGWSERERLRVLRILVGACAVVFVMVGVSSTAPVDVLYAVMEGATKLLHGVLPYGHMPGDVVHGDTYPVLSYLLYTPFAALSPVRSVWDSVDVGLGAAVLAALSVAGAAFRFSAGPRRRRNARPAAVEAAGLRAALTWLSFPPLLITVSTGTTDVVLGALLVFAVVLWRVPAASATLLAAAGWFKLAPFALVPIWLAPLRGRRLLTSAGAMLGFSLAMLALVVAIGGTAGLVEMARGLGYQFQRGSPQSLWAALGAQWFQPIGEAAVLALVAGACYRLRRDPALATREGIAALAAAVLLGLQLTANYWAFLYVVWVVPLMALSLLAERESVVVGAVAAPSKLLVPGLVPSARG